MSLLHGVGSGLGGAGDSGGALGSSSFYSHTVSQSFRLNGTNGYLSKTNFGTATNTSKRTFSTWIKTCDDTYTSYDHIVGAGSSNIDGFGFDSNAKFAFLRLGADVQTGTAQIRDVSAWMHVMFTWDSTAGNWYIYINGVQDSTGTASAALTKLGQSGQTNTIGKRSNAGQYIHGYLAQTVFLDGTIGSVSDFGETKDGVWVPKNITGLTFGTNGYFLDYADSSDLGKDVSGQDNHWTSNNLDTADQVPDSPTNNFATLNSIYHSSSQAVLSEGNLKADTAGFVNAAHGYGAVSTFAIPKDKKIYIEVECTDGTGDNWFAGFATRSGLESGPSSTTVGGSNAITVYNRQVYINGSENDYGSSSSLGGLGVSKLQSGDILGCAIDGATGKVWFSRNGTYFGKPLGHNSGAGATGDPAAGTNEIGTITNGTTEDVFFVIGGNTSVSSIFVNFGQDSVNVASAQSDGEGIGTFEYAPPTDYVCLCSSNLSDITIGPGQDSQADDFFNTVLYTGTGSSLGVTGVGFSPGWIWIKKRSASENHALYDVVRGTPKRLQSNVGNKEDTGGLTSFDSDGFTVNGSYGTDGENSATYVAWNWLAGGTPSGDNSAANNAEPTAGSAKVDGSNQSGAFSGSPSIAIKRLSANTTSGFSIVRWTGTSSAGTIPHGLGVAPDFYVVKNLDDDSTSWQAYHRAIASDAETDYIYLDSTAGANDSDDFNDTAPTANVFSVKSHNQVNESGDDYIAYVFAPIEGYSKFGSYIGGGSIFPFVFTGFRPAFVLLKKSSASGDNWSMYDNKRDTDNAVREYLIPNDSQGAGATDTMDFVSNGFKVRNAGAYINTSGATYIYWAFAEQPFKFANAR